MFTVVGGMERVFERSELTERIRLFSEHLYAQNLVERPDSELSFQEVSLHDRYRPRDAVALLLDPSPSFFGHKETMFAGFASWVILPNHPAMRLELIGLCIKQLLAKAEAIALEDFGENSVLMHDLIARYVIAGPQFIEEIYAPFGGMEVLSDFGSRTAADHLFDDERKSFYTIKKMMASCHYVASSTPADGVVQPSVNKAVATVRTFIDPKIMSRASIYAKWAECKDTIAWICAAESIELEIGTLLDTLLQANATFEEHGKLFDRWARRAKFFCEHVLRRMPDRELYDANIRPLRKVDAERFSLDLLTPSEVAFTKKAYSL
ncbi:hypothetical protein [Rhizobium laguerreae]|uniref:hypothetical protein n=1 Tax=Rhizobium laguerreae TaxID=1076926 RepID=UPI001C902FE0|nr:hypothetical protein [Rhizobium laguerreae]MBY3565718.1 hypothetical protein [Rhizobium laguerreae]